MSSSLAACSPKTPAQVSANPWPRARHRLAPTGARAVRLCRYSGLNDKPRLALIQSALIRSPKTVSRLVAEFDQVPPPSTRPVACPADDGSEIVAHLAYRSGHSVRIDVHLSGCGGFSNGDVGGAGSGERASALVSELERLLNGRGVK